MRSTISKPQNKMVNLTQIYNIIYVINAILEHKFKDLDYRDSDTKKYLYIMS